MTKASDNLFPKVLLDMQTSAPAAPSDADWKLYAKPGGIYARSSNSEVGPFGSGGSGTSLNPGTSFPGSPSTNDLCFRTDRAILYYYDGTRWLSVNQFQIELKREDSGFTWPITATTIPVHRGIPPFGDTYDIWMETWHTNIAVATTNTGSAYWTCNLAKYNSALGGDTSIASFNTSADAANTAINKEITIGALLGSFEGFYTDVTKTSTPGALKFHGGHITCRVVG